MIPEINARIFDTAQRQVPLDSSAFLKERGHLRFLIQTGKIEEAREFTQSAFPQIFLENEIVRSLLDALKFLQIIQERKVEEALIFAQESLSQYSAQTYFPSLRDGREVCLALNDILSLVCYEDMQENSETAFMISERQKSILADEINNQILQHGKKKQGSQLELLQQQLQVA